MRVNRYIGVSRRKRIATLKPQYWHGENFPPALPREYLIQLLCQIESRAKHETAVKLRRSAVPKAHFSSCESIARKPDNQKKVSTEMNAPP